LELIDNHLEQSTHSTTSNKVLHKHTKILTLEMMILSKIVAADEELWLQKILPEEA
jgi:hypothetical protein